MCASTNNDSQADVNRGSSVSQVRRPDCDVMTDIAYSLIKRIPYLLNESAYPYEARSPLNREGRFLGGTDVEDMMA